MIPFIFGFTAALGLAALANFTGHKLERSGLLAVGVTVAVVATFLSNGSTASAAVATVPLGTSAAFATLGGSTVTNTGTTVLHGSLGVAPGTAVTGFPPGLVVAPGTTNLADGVASLAQSDLTNGYNNAAGRPIGITTTADLVGLKLPAGVYAGPGASTLSLTGSLVLDGQGDPSSVFIFRSDSTLITNSDSTIALINGAQECNVFWQVGSSATLGTNSVFVGTIMAMASITATTGTIVHGRLLARSGAVTLDSNTVESPTCDLGPTATTTSSTTSTSTTSSTILPSTTSTTSVIGTTSTSAGPTTTPTSGETTTALSPATTTTSPSATTSSSPTAGSTSTTGLPGTTTAPTIAPAVDSIPLLTVVTTSIAPEPPTPTTTTTTAATTTTTPTTTTGLAALSNTSTTTTKTTKTTTTSTTVLVGVKNQTGTTLGQTTVKVLGETIIAAGEAPTATAILSQPKFTG